MVDQTLDNCENLVGKWQANNKFLSLCSHLDLICDKVETLNYQTMDAIGNPAKELNKDLEEVLKILRQMQDVNYDKNKIDYLFGLLELAMECEPELDLILERLQALEKIHKESPNIESAINGLKERQKLIELSFKAEDQQINKTKKQFLEDMQEV